MNDNHFLNKIFNPQNFKEEDLKTIFGQYQKIEFAKNDYLIKEGTTANYASNFPSSIRTHVCYSIPMVQRFYI